MTKTSSSTNTLSTAMTTLMAGQKKVTLLTKVLAEKQGLLPNVVKKLAKGQKKIGTAIKLLAQRDELLDALKKIKNKKNSQLTKAFANTFYITAIITIISCPLALFTDRKEKGGDGIKTKVN